MDRPKAQGALADFSGTLLLVGAGKMGSAMLEGWLALGLDADKIAVLEPQPTSDIAALARAACASIRRHATSARRRPSWSRSSRRPRPRRCRRWRRS